MFKQYKEHKVDLQTPARCPSSHADADAESVDRAIPSRIDAKTNACAYARSRNARPPSVRPAVRPSVRL